jgi:hypothetical protein
MAGPGLPIFPKHPILPKERNGVKGTVFTASPHQSLFAWPGFATHWPLATHSVLFVQRGHRESRTYGDGNGSCNAFGQKIANALQSRTER